MPPNPRRLTAVYVREDRTWLVHLAEDERVHSYGRTFAQARAAIADASALWFEVPEPELDIATTLPPDQQGALDALAEARARLEESQAEVRERQVEAVRLLKAWGDPSTRDIAEILGISHQRVHQLLHPG